MGPWWFRSQYGPQPGEVIDRMLAEGERLRLVRGNADRELVALRRGEDIEIPDDVTVWAAAQLTEDQVLLLADLPHPLVLNVDGFGPVVFCHGTPAATMRSSSSTPH